jgi:hypothetical protein
MILTNHGLVTLVALDIELREIALRQMLQNAF